MVAEHMLYWAQDTNQKYKWIPVHCQEKWTNYKGLLSCYSHHVQEGASLNPYGFDALIISSRLIPYFE